MIDNYNDSVHRTIGIEPNEAFETHMVLKNRLGLSNVQRTKVFFKIGDLVRVRKPRSIYTKGREAVYSKEVFKIVDSKANVYTLSVPYDGRLNWSYNSLLKVELPEGEEDKVKERKREQTEVIKKPIEVRKPSARIAQRERKATLRP